MFTRQNLIKLFRETERGREVDEIVTKLQILFCLFFLLISDLTRRRLLNRRKSQTRYVKAKMRFDRITSGYLRGGGRSFVKETLSEGKVCTIHTKNFFMSLWLFFYVCRTTNIKFHSTASISHKMLFLHSM